MAITCKRCGAKQGLIAAINTDPTASQSWYCGPCTEVLAAEKARKEKERIQRVMVAAAKVIVTTTPSVEGFRIAGYLGIESVEFVIGTGVFSEVTTSIADFFGARSSASERKLQQAKKHALDTLKYVAAEKGANAVVGVDLDFSELSGNRIALIINGTLVRLDPPPFADVPDAPLAESRLAAVPPPPPSQVASAPKAQVTSTPRAQEWMPEFPEDRMKGE